MKPETAAHRLRLGKSFKEFSAGSIGDAAKFNVLANSFRIQAANGRATVQSLARLAHPRRQS